MPNPKIRTSQSIDARTANTLQNKEKELMQSSQRIDYYKDGLGTRAVLNTDNLDEKQKGIIDSNPLTENMVSKYYFDFNYKKIII